MFPVGDMRTHKVQTHPPSISVPRCVLQCIMPSTFALDLALALALALSQLRLRYPLFVTFAAALDRRSIGLFGIGIIVAARRPHRTQTVPSAFVHTEHDLEGRALRLQMAEEPSPCLPVHQPHAHRPTASAVARLKAQEADGGQWSL